MSTRKVPLYKIFCDQDDVDRVSEVIKQGMSWAIGPKVNEFEETLAKYLDRKYCAAFNSGTSGLHAILLAYGIKSNCEVIVPSFTFIATANSVLFCGGQPVFADIEEETYGLSPGDVEKKITKKTRAIMPIHYGGSPCLIEELKEIAEARNLPLIEDAAESLGAKSNGRKVGAFGDAAVLSFCGNKVITTGEGGAVVTDERSIYEKLKLIRSHGRVETQDYFSSSQMGEYVTVGYNWRMSNITAALGLSQMAKLEKAIMLRREKAEYMTKRLLETEELMTPKPSDKRRHVYQMYTLRVKDGAKTRDALQNHLTKKGITTKVYFPPAHLTEFYRNEFGYKGGELPVTESMANQVLTLPIYPTMTADDMDYVIASIKEFIKTLNG